MSLPLAARGSKRYLRAHWESGSFDFESACRAYGRNNAFWILCYRRHLEGTPLPDKRERNRLVRDANRATGGLDQYGEVERYTRHEAQATIEQVALYGGGGYKPLLAKRRAYRGKLSPAARDLLGALCDVAEEAKRNVFKKDHRSLARMIGVDRSRIAGLLAELERAKQVWRCGFDKPRDGYARGISRFTLYPPRPAQNIDEKSPPVYDATRARWVWSSPLERGRMSHNRWRWLASRARSSSVPNVSFSSSSREGLPTASAFAGSSVLDNPLRGSP